MFSLIEAEKRLVKELKKYKGLLREAQESIEQLKADTTSRAAIKQLRDQVLCPLSSSEDSPFCSWRRQNRRARRR